MRGDAQALGCTLYGRKPDAGARAPQSFDQQPQGQRHKQSVGDLIGGEAAEVKVIVVERQRCQPKERDAPVQDAASQQIGKDQRPGTDERR
jgi:hypothetical protein